MTHSRNGERMLSCSFLPFSKSQSLTTIHTNSCTHVVPIIQRPRFEFLSAIKYKKIKSNPAAAAAAVGVVKYPYRTLGKSKCRRRPAWDWDCKHPRHFWQIPEWWRIDGGKIWRVRRGKAGNPCEIGRPTSRASARISPWEADVGYQHPTCWPIDEVLKSKRRKQ